MPLFSATDVAEFRTLVDDLAFHDTYAVQRADTSTLDAQGNRVQVDITVEAGTCNLRAEGLRPTERAIADRLSWITAYAIDLPPDTLVTPNDRIAINGRTFHVGGVVIAEGLAMVATAICEERSA